MPLSFFGGGGGGVAPSDGPASSAGGGAADDGTSGGDTAPPADSRAGATRAAVSATARLDGGATASAAGAVLEAPVGAATAAAAGAECLPPRKRPVPTLRCSSSGERLQRRKRYCTPALGSVDAAMWHGAVPRTASRRKSIRSENVRFKIWKNDSMGAESECVHLKCLMPVLLFFLCVAGSGCHANVMVRESRSGTRPTMSKCRCTNDITTTGIEDLGGKGAK